MKKFLIVGLGNVGNKYNNTRHNFGFHIIDEICKQNNLSLRKKQLWEEGFFFIEETTVLLLKPMTYMNLSGNAVKKAMKKNRISHEELLVITDDISLPLGKIRLRKQGSAGGHNGLKDIESKIMTNKYSRMRLGVGADFSQGEQADFVLSKWKKEEKQEVQNTINLATKAVYSFVANGIENTMNTFN